MQQFQLVINVVTSVQSIAHVNMDVIVMWMYTYQLVILIKNLMLVVN